MRKERFPSITWLRDVIREEDGRLFWLKGSRSGKEAGWLAVKPDDKRWLVRIAGITMPRSIVVWALHHGRWPESYVDHENRDSLDDRISNLRLATASQNGANAKLSKRNTSGYKGVTWNANAGKWLARIHVYRSVKHLGYFDDPKEAHAAYVQAARSYYGEFACGG